VPSFADAALEAMNGQYLMNRPLSLSYAFKKDSRGERHGTPAERLLAAQVCVQLELACWLLSNGMRALHLYLSTQAH
jgi:hypothetical protein